MKFKTVFVILCLFAVLTSCTAQADTAPLENEEISLATDGASSADALCITDGGEHRLNGTYNGTVVVDADEADVSLVLDGVNITSGGKAAIYVKSANSVKITLVKGSENVLVGKKGVHSTAELTIDGDGTLSITATEGHGIVARKNITVDGGNFVITSPKDGIHASNDTEPTAASICINGGTISVTSDGDGISTSGNMEINDGEITVVSGGGIANAVEHEGEWDFMGGMRSFFGFGDNSSENDTSSETDDTVQTSFKSVKADGDIVIRGGNFTLESAEDTIHTNSNITIDGGTFALTSGDDAIHADLALVINDGQFDIYDSYEGIEAKTIDVNGGIINVRSTDDGFNASGGTSTSRNPMAAEEGVYLKFSGGTVFVNADGDGVDSNGDLIVEGGELYVSGPTDSANGALDSGGDAIVYGGIVIAVGDSGMAESFGSQSTQGSISVNTGRQSAGAAVTLADSDGNVILSRTFEKEFSNVVVSCPEITDGGTYTVTAGTYSETLTMDGLQYGSGGGFGNFGGGFGNFFGGGGRGDGGKKNDKDKDNRHSDNETEVPQMPDREVPQMPDGEAPQMPDGEVPQMPDGEVPQMPDGEAPQMPDGEVPQMPDGEIPQMPDGEIPQMPDGEAPQMPDGEVPQMPDGEDPQMPDGGFDPGAMGVPDKP